MVLGFLIEKEIRQIMRNIILPVIFVLFPLVMTNLVPRVATMEIKGLRFTLIDHDHSTMSRRLAQKISASGYFSLLNVADSYSKAMVDIQSGKADIILEIPQGFERDYLRTGTSQVMASANAVNGTQGAMGQAYLMQIIQSYGEEMLQERGELAPSSLFRISPRFLFNLELDYRIYMVPAVLGLILILIVGFLPALNIVSEKEKGTIEQINVTPLGKTDFILGKIIPYFFIGILMLTLALLAVRLIYGFTPAGGYPMIYLFASLFALVAASLGLVISNYAETMQQAALTMFFFIMVFMLMSGLLTPVSCMPEWAQYLTRMNPMRYSIEAFRAIFIKGASLSHLMIDLLSLLLLFVVLTLWAVASYRKNS